MRLFELFDKKADWKWQQRNTKRFGLMYALSGIRQGVATISLDNGMEYEVTIECEKNFVNAYIKKEDAEKLGDIVTNKNIFYVQFDAGAAGSSEKTFNITGTGQEYAVFSTVIDIMKDYQSSANVDWWAFTAKEPSRKKLYDRMIKRFSSEYYAFDYPGEKVYLVKAQ